MNLHRDNSPTSPPACSAMKAMLSAYLDDELTREERLRSDAHLLECHDCRGLVERAETLDETLREKFALDLADAKETIDARTIDTRAMQASVLAAIGAPTRRFWLPRAAIAAGIAAAALASFLFWPSTTTTNSSTVPSTKNAQLAALDDDERQLLYSTSVILTNLRKVGFQNAANRGELREVARYDELVDRLDALLPKLPTEARPTVALARETIAFLIDSSEDPARWEKVRRDMERTELHRTVDGLSDA